MTEIEDTDSRVRYVHNPLRTTTDYVRAWENIWVGSMTPSSPPEPPKPPEPPDIYSLYPKLARIKTQTRRELQQLIEDMAADFRTLNIIHNYRADMHAWCGEYETRQTYYNEHLNVLRLAGRFTLGGKLYDSIRHVPTTRGHGL